MSYICDNCGKSIVVGRSQRHGRGVAGKRWRKRAQKTMRLFKPNLQKVSVLVSGKKVSMKLCTRCLKRFKKDGKIPSYTSAAIG
ncbi:hypothetical protein A2985_00525 [Candidatus Woesebacteria bacterium RIFCSPLOWO2_01_FULL_43_11]|nr:MAG: hypothetical protein A2985_00525 [Candidatus Woesebacteria bacterium RIFCSPLOWO2_01_FULL_43_11]